MTVIAYSKGYLVADRMASDGETKDTVEKIFSHGFTTRAGGHGFGLHSSITAAKAMNGSLTVQSDGIGRGARFTLELPTAT